MKTKDEMFEEFKDIIKYKDRLLAEAEVRERKYREALESANYTYLGGEYVACIKPNVIKQALSGE